MSVIKCPKTYMIAPETEALILEIVAHNLKQGTKVTKSGVVEEAIVELYNKLFAL